MREVRIKCVLLGEEATGKTSIVTRYTSGVFNEYSQSTIGAAFNAKPLTKDGFNIKFRFLLLVMHWVESLILDRSVLCVCTLPAFQNPLFFVLLPLI